MSEQSSYCPFVVGQHVVCVDASIPIPHPYWRYDDAPIEGAVYTVSRVGVGPSGEVNIALEEHKRHPGAVLHGYWGYRASRFRPAPSIAALTELLNKALVKEDAHV